MYARRFRLTLAAVLLCALTLSGCGGSSLTGKTLMRPPRLTGDQAAIERELQNKVSNYILKYPKGGEKPRDGEKRSAFIPCGPAQNPAAYLVFYQKNTESTTIYMRLIVKVDGVWQAGDPVMGPGTEIQSVSIEDLSGLGADEIVVSWNAATTTTKTLEVYNISGNTLLPLLEKKQYNEMQIVDLDNDAQKEILLIHLDSTKDTPEAKAHLYKFDENGAVDEVGTADMDGTVTSSNPYAALKVGELRAGVPAVFVDGNKAPTNSTTTEVIFWNTDAEKDHLTVLPYAENENLRSNRTLSTDIDKDGRIEIPQVYELPDYENRVYAEKLWLTTWYRYIWPGDTNRYERKKAFSCVMNTAEGYYFVYPEEWAFWVDILPENRRKQTAPMVTASLSTSTTDRRLTFSAWDTSANSKEEIFTIQAFTEADWAKDAPEGFQEIQRRDGTVFASKLGIRAGEYSMTTQRISNGFHLILP